MAGTSIAQTKAERLIRAYMEGAEAGMVEVRGYGLTAEEWEEAEREVRWLYPEPANAGQAGVA